MLEKKEKKPPSSPSRAMVELCHLLKKTDGAGKHRFCHARDVIIVDEKGVPHRIERVEYDITHQMIEEFMLKANETRRDHLSNKGKTLIYRVHEEPDSRIVP